LRRPRGKGGSPCLPFGQPSRGGKEKERKKGRGLPAEAPARHPSPSPSGSGREGRRKEERGTREKHDLRPATFCANQRRGEKRKDAGLARLRAASTKHGKEGRGRRERESARIPGSHPVLARETLPTVRREAKRREREKGKGSGDRPEMEG